MSIKLRKNSEYLANVQFPDAPRGYDTLEVDAVYDQIIKDYETALTLTLKAKSLNGKAV